MNMQRMGVRIGATAALSLACALGAPPLHAVELAITARAAAQALSERAFTRNGKYDLMAPQSKCAFAYLESPEVGFANDKLTVRFHLSARAAQDVGGQCIGVADAFWVTVSATPAVENNVLIARNLQIVELGNPSYRVLLELALKQGLERALRQDINALLRTALAKDPGHYRMGLRNLSITNLRARDNVLRGDVDFGLIVDLAQ